MDFRKYATSVHQRIPSARVRDAVAQIVRYLLDLARDLDKRYAAVEAQGGAPADASGDIPPGVVIIWLEASCPTGWTSILGTSGTYWMSYKFPIGGNTNSASTYYRNKTGGQFGHRHEWTFNLPASESPIYEVNAGTDYQIALDDHTHTWSAVSDNSPQVYPPFINVNFCRKD